MRDCRIAVNGMGSLVRSEVTSMKFWLKIKLESMGCIIINDSMCKHRKLLNAGV